MPYVWWDNRKQAGLQNLRDVINHQLKFPFNGECALLVDVPVPGYGASFGDLDKVYGVGFGVNQGREKAGRNFFYFNIGKFSENRFVHLIM